MIKERHLGCIKEAMANAIKAKQERILEIEHYGIHPEFHHIHSGVISLRKNRTKDVQEERIASLREEIDFCYSIYENAQSLIHDRQDARMESFIRSRGVVPKSKQPKNITPKEGA